jgi:ankyrin repeat protein
MVKLLLHKGAKLKNKITPEKNHFQIIKYLLQERKYPKETDYFGSASFQNECKKGNLKFVKFCIKHHIATVSTENYKGQTPVHLACERGNNLKMVKFLIEEQKANPAVSCNEGKTALHYAAKLNYDTSILRYLIEDQKLDVEGKDNQGKTALHLACQRELAFTSRWPTQKYLIEKHPKIIDVKDKDGKTALQYCSETFEDQKEFKLKNFRPIALILANKDLLKREAKEIGPIFDWIKQSFDSSMEESKKQDDIISCLISALTWFQAWLAKKEETLIQYNPLLLIASYCNRVDIAEYLFNQDFCYIEKHFKGEEPDSKRKLLLKSYLKFSCEYGFLDLTRVLFQEINTKLKSFHDLISNDESLLKAACRNKHIAVFKYLLEDKKAKDEADEFLKDFPLHYACKYGSLEMVQYLIETKSLSVEAKNGDGHTPLYIALCTGGIEIVKYLIKEKNASTDGIYSYGKNAFAFACFFGSIENVKYISGKTNPDVNAHDDNGLTALHSECERGDLKVIKFLITDMKANINSVDNEGRTPLHAACQYKFPNLSIPKFLVSQGADVLAKDNCGKTPLQVAKCQVYLPNDLINMLKAATKR